MPKAAKSKPNQRLGIVLVTVSLLSLVAVAILQSSSCAASCSDHAIVNVAVFLLVMVVFVGPVIAVSILFWSAWNSSRKTLNLALTAGAVILGLAYLHFTNTAPSAREQRVIDCIKNSSAADIHKCP